MSSGQYQQYVAESKITRTVNHSNSIEEESKVDKKEERRRKATGGKGGGGVQVTLNLVKFLISILIVFDNFE